MARSDWKRESQAIAATMPFPVAMEEGWMRARLEAVRDIIVVLGLQLVFRLTLFLRHWNY